MFEKSKSSITFKEFQGKINTVNNFENDWGHFYDPDNNNILFLDNSHLYREPQKKMPMPIQKPIQKDKQEPIQKPIKTPILNPILKPIQKDKQEPFIDIEKQQQKPEQKPEIPNLKNYIYKINKTTIFIGTIFTYIKTSLITLTMAYFIFKII